MTGPTALADPVGVTVVHVETACEMLAACEAALPVAIAVCAAAVSDWKVAVPAEHKIKKDKSAPPPPLMLVENPDILARLSRHPTDRPRLVIGFAAETEHLVENAVAKRARKGCDWIVANDVGPGTGTFGGTHNTVQLIRGDGVEAWPALPKDEIARRLAEAVACALETAP